MSLRTQILLSDRSHIVYMPFSHTRTLSIFLKTISVLSVIFAVGHFIGIILYCNKQCINGMRRIIRSNNRIYTHIIQQLNWSGERARLPISVCIHNLFLLYQITKKKSKFSCWPMVEFDWIFPLVSNLSPDPIHQMKLDA